MGIGVVITTPLSRVHDMKAHHDKRAHGIGVMEDGVIKAGMIGVPAMTEIMKKGIAISHGHRPLILSQRYHGLCHRNPLQSHLFRSHLRQL